MKVFTCSKRKREAFCSHFGSPEPTLCLYHHVLVHVGTWGNLFTRKCPHVSHTYEYILCIVAPLLCFFPSTAQAMNPPQIRSFCPLCPLCVGFHRLCVVRIYGGEAWCVPAFAPFYSPFVRVFSAAPTVQKVPRLLGFSGAPIHGFRRWMVRESYDPREASRFWY